MSDRTDTPDLTETARQILEGELMLAGAFLPAEQNPLPAIRAAAPAAHAAVGATRRTAAKAGPQPEGGTTIVGDSDKAAQLRTIDENEVRSCQKCGLCKSRTQTVFGEGDPNADLVFVGEGPGAEEDRTGRPFVGRAGELLTKMIQAMGLPREQVFICNMVRCRPPGNRAPAPEEVQACWDYLVRTLQTIQPKVIVTLGNPATQNLLSTRVGITKLRGTWQSLPDIGPGLEGTPVMPTFHPSYVLRNYNPDTRGQVWADLQQVMDRLGLQPPQK